MNYLIIEKIKEQYKVKNFDVVCQLFKKLDNVMLPNYMYILKAAAIQLSEDDIYTLDDAKKTLLYILELDNKYTNAWIDLGYFYFSMENDSVEAIKCFKKARELLNNLNNDLISGEIKALIELNQINKIDEIKSYINSQNELINKLIHSDF